MNSELKKSAQNGLYEFAPDGNGCRIYHAETPRYWYNYLWNEDRYCAQISQVGHGRSSAERKSNRTHYYKEQGISEQAQKEIAAILMRERRSRSEEAR